MNGTVDSEEDEEDEEEEDDGSLPIGSFRCPFLLGSTIT